jgi:hypothetical protein
VSSISEAMQVAAVARLLADETVSGLLATSVDGKAVFAPGQPFADVFPRITIEKPQKLRRRLGCGRKGWEIVLTLHHWARGPEASLVCGRLADAAEDVLDLNINPDGFAIQSERDHWESTREVGDPDPTVQHLVSTFRYLVNQ